MNRYSIMLGKKPPPKGRNSDHFQNHVTFSQFIEIDGHRWPAVIEILYDPIFHDCYRASVTIHGTLARTVPVQSYICKINWKGNTATFHVLTIKSETDEYGRYLTTLKGDFSLK